MILHQATGWAFADEKATNLDKTLVVEIVHRHHFNSNLKRMSAIVHCKV